MGLSDAQVDELGGKFEGVLLRPGGPGYDDARAIFNSMIDRRPALIAQCASAADVQAVLELARGSGLPTAVRGGGHSVAGKSLCDDGIVIDLRRMNAVSVDPEARTATVGGGATMSDLDRGTEPHGLATTGGRVSTTGVGGFTLGGGAGWLDRKLGLACNRMLSAELVTADGRVVTASEDENPELFWALHGGGGNFGVATSFRFRLDPVPVVTAALLIWPPERGPEVMRRYRDFLESAPDEVGGGVLYLTGPEEDFVPEKLVNELACAVLVTYAGGGSEAREVMKPILEQKPAGQMIESMPYAELQCMLDDPPGYRNYWSAEYLEEVPDEAVDLFCARASDMIVPSPSQHVLFPQGGEVGRGDGDIPISWSEASWVVHPFGLWEDPDDDERGRQWAKDIRADLQPWATGATYHNFMGDEGKDRLVAGFGRENYDRLARVKAEYDPDNLFRLNPNVEPAPA
ncbi:MAG: FAD-binding oxidoreductase [Solirubrobacterales bacterium]